MRPASDPAVPAIHDALVRGVDDGVFPGGAAAVFLRGELVHLSAAGAAQLVPDRISLTPDAVFDLASVTKVVATTAAVAVLAGRKLIGLDDPVVRFWPAFARNGKKSVTLRHLLAHSSGLPAWRKFFLDIAADPGAGPLFRDPRPEPVRLRSACRRGKQLGLEVIEEVALERAPGLEAVYSDLGFIALGHVVELVTGERLDRFVEREVFAQLHLPSLHFRPIDEPPRARARAPFAATGVHRWREPAPGQEHLVPAPPPAAVPNPRPGEVDDDNAYAMGGVAGHAGAFGNARDVAGFGQAVLEDYEGALRLAPPEVWGEFCRREGTPGSTRALGFDTPSEQGSSAGAHIARSRAVGHLGFTGTSLWIDLDRRLSIALLTNRVHPTRANEKIRAFRPVFHDVVVEALGLAGA